jgi:isoleucyl-tRNA synthetase
VCISSLAHLEALSGQKLTDVHREFVDQLEFKLKPDGQVLRRVPELFDCWFESGSMPYATSHYMFNPDTMDQAP